MNKGKSNQYLKTIKFIAVALGAFALGAICSKYVVKNEIITQLFAFLIVLCAIGIVLSIILSVKASEKENDEYVIYCDNYLKSRYGDSFKAIKVKPAYGEGLANPVFKGNVIYGPLEIEGKIRNKSFKYRDLIVEEKTANPNGNQYSTKFTGKFLEWEAFPGEFGEFIISNGSFERYSHYKWSLRGFKEAGPMRYVKVSNDKIINDVEQLFSKLDSGFRRKINADATLIWFHNGYVSAFFNEANPERIQIENIVEHIEPEL